MRLKHEGTRWGAVLSYGWGHASGVLGLSEAGPWGAIPGGQYKCLRGRLLWVSTLRGNVWRFVCRPLRPQLDEVRNKIPVIFSTTKPTRSLLESVNRKLSSKQSENISLSRNRNF